MSAISDPAVFDHVRPTAGPYEDGIYRVVGTDDGSVTLLRVGDADGRRVNTGAIVTVEAAQLERFEPAENPDGNRGPGESLLRVPAALYWSVRAAIDGLLRRPVSAAVAVAVLLTGSAGGWILDLPGVVSSLLVVAGGLGLALLASGQYP